MRLKIAARRSDLARLQAYMVGDALQKAQPGLEIEYQFKESLGDRNLSDPLWKMPEKGVFTEDFQQDLREGKTDLVVHSWKDLPIVENPLTVFPATLSRQDVRDLLLVKKKSRDSWRGTETPRVRIFSSSPRRSYNLIPFLQFHLPVGMPTGISTGTAMSRAGEPPFDIEFLPVRGNIATRLRKLIEAEDVDGLVVAKAALDRLLASSLPEMEGTQRVIREVLSLCEWMVLPLTPNPSAAAQGALAIEVLRSRLSDLGPLLEKIDHPQDRESVVEERRILAGYGGGCHQKIGVTVLVRPQGRYCFLRGETDAGETLNTVSFESSGPSKGFEASGVGSTAKGSSVQESAAEKSPALGLSMWCEASSRFFSKEKLSLQIDSSVEGIYVSHSEAWVDGAEEGRWIWTAGLATWKALARRGIWVNGSSEGLGEDESLRIEELCVASHQSSAQPSVRKAFDPRRWRKLTHEGAVKLSQRDGVGVHQRIPALASYRLVPKATAPLIPEDYETYYWRSGSLFEWATSRQPQLLHKKHYCGPGNTFEELRKKEISLEILWPAPRSDKNEEVSS